MMQDWLTMHKLDRKALAALSGNAQAVQTYQDYLQMTVQDVVEEIISVLDPPATAQQGTSQNDKHAWCLICIVQGGAI